MLIAQISDTHIAGPGLKTCGVAPMAENLTRCVDSINNLIPRPDLVVLAGDLAHTPTKAEVLRADQILSKLECPLFIVPGNHDDRDDLWEVFRGRACPSRADGFINYVVDGYPLRIIAVDSTQKGQAGGWLCDARLAWLRNSLAQGGDQPSLIFMHHPPLKLGVHETDIDGFVGADQLGDIVADFPNIERILCGHIHLQTHTRWRGTIVTTAPSIGMQLTLDLTQKAPSKFLLSEPAYLVHHWTPDRALVSHAIHLSDPEGPFDFT